MNTRISHKTTAIVLRCLDYGESDRIVILYTNEFGKVHGIAKGARRSRKRFANALELFSCAQILFSRKGRDTLALIENSDVIDHYAGIRGDLEKTLMASYLIELIDHFTVEGKVNEALFRLLRDFLGVIDSQRVSEQMVSFFEIRLLKLVGYEPVLDRCLICQTPIRDAECYQFFAAEGGIKCTLCDRSRHSSLPISIGAIKTLLLGRDMEIDRVVRLGHSRQISEESRQLLACFIRQILGKDPKSLKILNQIKAMSC